MTGLLIAAPASGSGKTTITLGLLRALKRRGVAVAPGKAGPDYIDPAFHAAASGEACFNFDPWGMRPEFLSAQADMHGEGRYLLVEAMMGLYDAGADAKGSPADLAVLLGLDVVFVVDCARMSQSVAALVSGYRDFRRDLKFAGVILNRVGSARHEAMLKSALDAAGIRAFGSIPADKSLQLPDRHLGLVQASEHGGLEAFIETAANSVETHCDVSAILSITQKREKTAAETVSGIAPLGQKIAVARDIAFAFSYPHLLESWRRAGATLSFFSPLGDEEPEADCDAIYLPGGYPELHAGKLADAAGFKASMSRAAMRDAKIYGECGGYMVLGRGLIDADGKEHSMLGLLPHVTSFQARKRHLGYRRVKPVGDSFFNLPMTAHEFHYSTLVEAGDAEPLFSAADALGADLGSFGSRRGNIAGSYLHLIDLAGEGV